MSSSTSTLVRRAAQACALLIASALLGGCAVAMVAGAAVGVAATGAGLVVDAAVGTVKAVGSVVLPSKDDEKK
jgi:hypothetical protein